jgi:hypothetical protein
MMWASLGELGQQGMEIFQEKKLTSSGWIENVSYRRHFLSKSSPESIILMIEVDHDAQLNKTNRNKYLKKFDCRSILDSQLTK